jgi:hypothetical protein
MLWARSSNRFTRGRCNALIPVRGARPITPTSTQLEHRVLLILDRLRAKEPTEDLRVEIKTEWPTDISRAARRIAGHANAARGEPILWIIGADEKQGVIVGAGEEELANWWPQIQSQFSEGVAPDLLLHLIVPTEAKAVVALLLDTTRTPYVVKNPDGGTVQLEVPWRDATSVKSARRSDLIRMLVPLQQLPDVEILDARLDTYVSQEGSPNRVWSLGLELYIVPVSREQIVIPFRKCRATLAIAPFLPERTLSPLRVQPGAMHQLGGDPIPSLTVRGGNAELVIDGPGSAYLSASFNEELPRVRGSVEDAVVRVTLQSVHTSFSAVAEARLTFKTDSNPDTPKWAYISQIL